MSKVVIGKSRQVVVNEIFLFLFPYKEKKLAFFHKYYIKNNFLYILFQNNITLTIVNWISQGISYMSKIEKIFHLLFECCLIIIFLFAFNLSFIWSFIWAHTINWMFNSHFWVFMRFWKIPFNKPENYYAFLKKLNIKLQSTNCFQAVLLIGGPARNKPLTEFSDLDVKFIAKNDIYSILKGNIFLLKEKCNCFFSRIPFDGNIFDSLKYLETIDQDESPIALYTDSTINDTIKAKYKIQNNIFK